MTMTQWRRVYYVVPVVALVIPFLANEYLLWVVNAMLVYSLVTVGFNIVIGNLGQLAFANTAFFGIGAYTTAILMHYLGFPYLLGIAVSAIMGGVAGFLASVAAAARDPALLPRDHHPGVRRAHALGVPARRRRDHGLGRTAAAAGELLRNPARFGNPPSSTCSCC